jgi:hypothetical protein
MPWPVPKWTTPFGVLAWVSLAGCAGTTPSWGAAPNQDGEAPTALQWQTPVPKGPVDGFTHSPDDRFWLLQSAGRTLIPLRLRGSDGVGVEAPVAIENVAAGFQLESAIWVSPDRILFGVALDLGGRSQDFLLDGNRVGKAVVVQDAIPFDYRLWAMIAEPGHGVRGLCRQGDQVFAVSASAGASDEGRFAPLGAYDLSTRTWGVFRLALPTLEGRIVDLACDNGTDGALWATYRDGDKLALLSIQLPGAGSPEASNLLVPTVKRIPVPVEARFAGSSRGLLALSPVDMRFWKVSNP